MKRTTAALLLMALLVQACAPAVRPLELPPEVADRDPKLYPGDVVRLVVWREEDLTGEFPVNEDGVVVLPMVGPYDVTGMTVDSLHAELLKDFRVSLRNPSISIQVLRRVKVLGAVTNPGLYQVDRTMTIGDALALAGGADRFGKRDRIELIRDGSKLTDALNEGTPLEDLPIRSGDSIFVPEKSWLSQNFPAVVGVISATVGLAVALITAGNRTP